MKFAEFAENLKKAYAEKFPNSEIIVEPCSDLGRFIWIHMYLSNGKSECAYNIRANDVFCISFSINLPDKFDFQNDNLPENLTLEAYNKAYKITPENTYLYFSSRNLTYRKTSGNAEKLTAAMQKFIAKLYDSVIADLQSGKIHKEYIELVKRKIT